MKKPSFTLQELATLTKSELKGNPNCVITDVSGLESAKATDISFLSNPRFTSVHYERAMTESKAGAILVAPEVVLPEGKNFLIHPDPTYAFQIVLEAFRGKNPQLSGFEGIHPTAVIHETGQIGDKVTVGPHAVIDKETSIGDRSFIGAGCYIGPKCKIGQDCTIHPNVTIREECVLQDRVIVQPGAVIGSCGFGYTTDEKGCHHKLTHWGNVLLEEDVEIGANATIDRSRFATTKIGSGSKIDNLVLVAHNCDIGKGNLFAGQVGIAGSVKTGNLAVFGGQVGVNGHITIADQVLVAAKSGVSKSITESGKYGGIPARPLKEYNKTQVVFRRLGKSLQQLEERIKKLEKTSAPQA